MAQTVFPEEVHPEVPVRKVNKIWGVCLYVLVVEMCERFCFYTLYFTYPTYLVNAGSHRDGIPQSAANGMKQSFKMLAYLAPVLGGYLADNVYGRYKTILYFTICYVVGMAMIAVAAMDDIMESKDKIGFFLFIIGSFVFVSFGTGAIKPNVVNFGAQQYDENDPEEAEQQKSYFSYFYLVINIGGIVASIWMTGLATSGVQDTTAGNGFFYAYLAAAIAMALALLVFLLGTPKYNAESKAVPQKSAMLSIVNQHIMQGARTSWQGKVSILGWVLIPVYLLVSLCGSLITGDGVPSLFKTQHVPGVNIFQFMALLLLVISCTCLIVAHRNNDWIQPPAMGQVDGELTTEEVRGFMRALPTIVCVTVGFNVCYGGMDVYPIQACQMDCQTGAPEWLNDFFFLGKTKQFNSTFFGLGDNLAIIIMIPLFEAVIWPFCKRCRGGVPVQRMTKFNLGFFFCIIACVVGIILEVIRKKQPLIECPAEDMYTPVEDTPCFCRFQNGTHGSVTGHDCVRNYHGVALLVSNCAPAGVPMSQISGWWTFVPFWLTGCGEILVNPVVQEFSYDEVSPRLKSLLMGITMVVTGCLPAVISAGFTGFIPNDLNNGDVNYVFYAYIVVGVLLLFAYWGIALPEKVRATDAPGTESLLSRSLAEGNL